MNFGYEHTSRMKQQWCWKLLSDTDTMAAPVPPQPRSSLPVVCWQFYPSDFETDRNGKQNTWESVVLIPFIDEDLMVDALSNVDHKDALNPPERARNILGRAHTFLPAVSGKIHAPSVAPVARRQEGQGGGGGGGGERGSRPPRRTPLSGSGKRSSPAAAPPSS